MRADLDVRSRWALLAIGILQLMQADITRVPHVQPHMGIALYGTACALFVVAFITSARFWIRVAVSWAIAVGLVRSLLYLFDDGRLPPLGFNLSIALLLYLNYTTHSSKTGR